MKPVMQTRMGGDPTTPGNCFAAAIASILEVSLDEIPDEKVLIDRTERIENEADERFYSRCWSNYWIELSNWLRDSFGLGMMELEPKCFHGTGFMHDDDAYMIASGDSPRGLPHAVVCKGVEMVHDPHPEGGGIVNESKDTRWILFVPLDPAKAKGVVC